MYKVDKILRKVRGQYLTLFLPLFARLQGGTAAIGTKFEVDAGVRFSLGKGCKLVIKDSVQMLPNSTFSVGPNAYLEIGTRCSFGQNNRICAQGSIVLGDHVFTSEGVKMYDSNHNFIDLNRPMQEQGDDIGCVQVGSDVWLADGVKLLSGSHIRRGTIVAAGGVVSRGEYPEWAILGGVPAKIIEDRRKLGRGGALTDVAQKKIAVCVLSFELNGASKTAFSLIEALNEQGIVPDVYLLMPNTTGIEVEYPDVRMNVIPYPFKRWPTFGLFQKVDISGSFPYSRYFFVYDFTYCIPSKVKSPLKNALFHVQCPQVLAQSPLEFPTPWRRLYLAFFKVMNTNFEKRVYKNTHIRFVVFDKVMQGVFRAFCGRCLELVAYPPVDVTAYWNNNREAREGIVTVSRFARCKKQLDQAKLAQNMPEYHFDIIGGVSELAYFKQVQEYISKNNLTNVTLHPDAPRAEVIQLCQKAKYFIHAMENEHFGLVTAEAIAAGCIPIVHDSWGSREIVTWDALRFKSVDEIPDKIRWLDNKVGDDVLSGMMGELQRDVWKYDTSEFKKGMLKAGGLL